MISLLNDALQISAPLLILLVFGIYLKHIKFVDEPFVAIGNKLVFQVGLPCLLFLSITTRPEQGNIELSLVGFAIIATIISVGLIWIVSPLLVKQAQKGVFTQCAFRGNMGIIGLALCINAYGDQGLAQISIYLAVMSIVYNILAVLLLSSSKNNIVSSLLKNPLIIGIFLGYLWSVTGLNLPKIIAIPIQYLSNITLPLALICIGASLNWLSLKENHKEAIWCTSIKLVILPCVICGIALTIGIKGQSFGILFLMMSTPTAAAGYIMAKQMTHYGDFAAEVVTLSTLLSPLSVTIGLVTMKYYGLM